MQIPTFQTEQELNQKYPDAILIGVDEVGRGPLAGPVVAAACALHPEIDQSLPEWDFVRDSKKVTEKRRESTCEFIKQNADYGIGIIASDTIDRVNILEATFLAMKAALSELRARSSRVGLAQELILLVDGAQKIPHISHTQITFTSGDARVKSIAAASILAKVTRDSMMVDYDKLFPGYGFGAHKGYGTKQHMEALREKGVTPIHRHSFAPVKKCARK